MVFRECGCRTYMTDHPNLFVPMVEYCPMHEAAPEMLDALKAAPALPMKSNIDFWYGVYDEWRDKFGG